MTFYEGPPRGSEQIKITSPCGTNLVAIADAERWKSAGGADADTVSAVETWTNAARQRDDVVLFEVAEENVPVGQIFLHDINADKSESLIGYHLLTHESRGRGIGTRALELILDYVRCETELRWLVIITSGDNPRSRRIAEKNGFAFTGPPREDPNGVCLKLEVIR